MTTTSTAQPLNAPLVTPAQSAAPPWDISGPEGAPAIIFVHGTRLTRASWLAVSTRLDDRFRCLRLDLPAHGARSDEPFTLDAAVAAVEAATEAVGGRAVVVGLSLGGYVGMALAGHAPARVRGLVLAGASAEPRGLQGAAFRLYAWVLGVAPERPLDAFNTWLLQRRYPAEIVEPIVADGYWSRGGAQAVLAIAATTFRDRLEAFRGPVLVINGDLDLVFRLGERPFVAGIPNVTRRVLRWTTHLSPLDRPEAFAAAVRDFMDRVPG